MRKLSAIQTAVAWGVIMFALFLGSMLVSLHVISKYAGVEKEGVRWIADFSTCTVLLAACFYIGRHMTGGHELWNSVKWFFPIIAFLNAVAWAITNYRLAERASGSGDMLLFAVVGGYGVIEGLFLSCVCACGGWIVGLLSFRLLLKVNSLDDPLFPPKYYPELLSKDERFVGSV